MSAATTVTPPPVTPRRAPESVRRVVWIHYGFQFFFGLLVWVPVFYTYQRVVGLDDREIFGIQSIYYVAFCLFEIPTGLLADRLGLRRSMIGGAAVLLLANLVPVAAPGYAGFLVHWLLIALARSLVSGAASAYLYEYLQRHDASWFYQRAEGNARAYSLVGKIVCWPAAGALMAWLPASVYWLTALNAAVALVLALRLPALLGADPEHPEARASTWRTVGGAARFLRRSPLLMLVMVQGIAVFTLSRILQVNLVQPILTVKDTPVVWHGTVLAAMTVFEVAGAAASHRVRRFTGDLAAVSVLTVVMAASLALVVPAPGVLTVVCLCAFSLVAGLVYPVQRKLLNEAITDSRYRATLLSIESLIDRAVCAVVALLLGSYLATGRLQTFLLLSAGAAVLLIVLVAPLSALVSRRRRVTAGSPS
ncbi:MFS transporter [Couchioplanes azureus]|uniref:MFS transporter n=1 Tax=Couchioplanes caeruleus TaxID=56438 RepID=UPI00167158D0|nr:MFS transporter [Couchioplanes caeruleus]GGQ87667.1 MFS transporter [Couchioplanes caeruleus subsp. azureus]